jgi:hypothetical protein
VSHNRPGRLARSSMVTGLAVISMGAAAVGTASASQPPAAATYKSIVAHFNKLAGQTNAPSASAITSAVDGTAKALMAVHWKGRTERDVTAEAKDLKGSLPLLLASAKNPNVNPTAKEKAAATSLITDSTQVRKDLGLPANANGL